MLNWKKRLKNKKSFMKIGGISKNILICYKHKIQKIGEVKMTVKKFLSILIVFILSINIITVFGEDYKQEEFAYTFGFGGYNFYYNDAVNGKKEHKKALKSSRQPTDYFIGTYFGYSFGGEVNANEYVEGFESTNFFVFVLSAKVSELKKYSFSLINENGNQMNNRYKVDYIGYTNSRYRFCMVVDVSKTDLLQRKIPNKIKMQLDGIVYTISLIELENFNDLQQYIRQLERDEQQRQREEYIYKNSKEYKQIQLQKLLNELSKNKIYDIEKDNFENKIHVTSSRVGQKIDNNILNILNKNNIFIVPRCEIGTEYGSLDFGMTITQKANLTRGSVYIKGISFSNGDESTTIRIGTVNGYAIGEVGKVININGLLDGVQITTRLSEGYVDDLYNILINAKKPVMVRVHAGEYTYDSVISDLEKNMFIDILKIKQLKDGVKN